MILMGLLLGLTAQAADVVLVPAGADWRYRDAGVAPAGTWVTTGFDDSAWSQGPARLGYGDPEIDTPVSFGPDASDKHRTTWFRTTFTVPAGLGTQAVRLDLLRDDGAVVYLNGVEVVRSNMPAGAIGPNTFAASTVSGAEEDTFEQHYLAASALQPGLNVLAVEVHQRTPDSSDLALDLSLTSLDDVATVVRGPYLQQVGPHEVTVRWRTDIPVESRVYTADVTPGTWTGGATVPGARVDHEVRVTGLPADRAWFYGVGTPTLVLAGGDGSYRFRTAPLPGSPDDVRVWVVGDSGTANADAAAVRDAWLQHPDGGEADVWLMLGDNAYNDGLDTEYQAAVFDMYPTILRRTPLWSTLGNHDGHSADSATNTGPYYDIFTLPTQGEIGGEPSGTEAWYSFDHGPVHFICLDSYDSDRTAPSLMLDWLEDDLAATSAPWVIAFWHHPPYSKGSHDSDQEAQLIQMRTNAVPLLEAYGVDLVLSGHSHAYERSMLLDSHHGSSSTLTPAMVLDPGDGDPAGDGSYRKPSTLTAPHEGAVFTVAGSSGKTSGGSYDHPAMHISLRALGSLMLDVQGSRLTGRFLDDQGAIRDTFQIHKGLDLAVSTLTPGSTVRLTVSGASPGERVWFAASLDGTGDGTCPTSFGGSCLGLVGRVRVLDTAVADTAGVATITVSLPASVPAGRTIGLQAAQLGGRAELSEALSRQTGPAACAPTPAPVCGVDGTTYPNACEAERAGWPVRHDGGC